MKKEIIKSIDGRDVLRATYEALDYRFYYDEGNPNTRTQKPWKPSCTTILDMAPRSKFLDQWIGGKGFEEAERIKNKAGDLGRFIHEQLDKMIRGDSKERVIKSADIDVELSAKDANKVKKCLKGFTAFWQKYQPKPAFDTFDVEKAVLFDDCAGTQDLRCRLNVDDYKHIWAIDFKSSKSIHWTHKVQVSKYASGSQCERAAILQLGNTTKQRYTFSEVVDLHNYTRIFDNLKETYYLLGEYTSEVQLFPNPEEFPEEFKI